MSTDSERREIALRITTAHQAQRLSGAALAALNRAPGSSLALGTPMVDFDSEEGLLVTVMPDDSTSLNRIVRRQSPPNYSSSRRQLEGERTDSGLIRPYYDIIEAVEPDNPESNTEAIRIGHNAVLEALRASQHPEKVLFATRYLNGQLLNPYGPLKTALSLDRRNFWPRGGTPLYDQTVELLKMVLAKYEQFRADWREARTVTLLVTDGRDEHSRIQRPPDVLEVIQSMKATGHHIVAAMGIDDGKTNFRQVFLSMGIDPKWILTTGSTQGEIQEAFGLFAKVASQATVITDFSRMLASGFGGITKKP